MPERAVFAFPRGVTDPLCPDEHVVTTSTDRRLLWHLENSLAVLATTDYLRDIQRTLSTYLHETCEHHWHEVPCDSEADFPGPLWQCLWCNYVEDEDPLSEVPEVQRD